MLIDSINYTTFHGKLKAFASLVQIIYNYYHKTPIYFGGKRNEKDFVSFIMFSNDFFFSSMW